MFRSLPIILIGACFLGLVASASAADDRDRCTSSIDDDALAACTRLIRINPKNAEAFINRGNVNLARGERDGAIADFSEAIRLNPKNAYAFARRCAAYQAKAEPDQAIADCTEAIRLDPKFAGPYLNRGNASLAKGEQDRALADFGDAIRLNPKLGVAFIRRGMVYRQKGDVGRAIADFSEAIRLNPNDADALTHRGLSLQLKGDLERAKTDYSAALNAGQGSAWSRDTAQLRLRRVLNDLSQTAASRALGVVPSQTAGAPAARSTAIPSLRAVSTERRVALVIGNSGYQNVPMLENPRNDAKAIADALTAAGFQSVRLVTDATHSVMVEALRVFEDEADAADWAVVYYAGHGMEIGGVNYLIPTDAHLRQDREAQDEAVSLGRVLDAISMAKRLKLVMLDACRENPFSQQMRRTVATRAVSRGLARIEPDDATLVFYAAKDGEVAADGADGHSPFTAALLKRFVQPGIEINRLLRLVTGDVLQATNRLQRPFVYGSISGDDEYYFRLQ